ncbi:hypothetical protein Q8A73_009280 [Channa argus]|nr:hypothetical protein Q8A73_009280 [Channa argus]
MHLSEGVLRVQQAVVPKPEPASGDSSPHPPLTFHLRFINAARHPAEATQAARPPDTHGHKRRTHKKTHYHKTTTCQHTNMQHERQKYDATDCICCPQGVVH